MKLHALPAILGATLVLVSSCSKDALFQHPVPGTPDTGGMASSTSMDFTMYGGETRFALTSDSRWQVQPIPDWITVTPMYGDAGTSTITVSTRLNLDEIHHTDLVIETYNGTKKLVEISVAQDCVSFNVKDDLPSTETERLFSWIECFKGNYDKPVNIDIESNVDWKIEVVQGDAELLHLGSTVEGISLDTPVSASEEMIPLQLMPENANFSQGDVSMEVKITPLLPDGTEIPGLKPYTLNMRQSNLLFLADWTADTPLSEGAAIFNELGPEKGHTEYLSAGISVESEEDWTVLACPDWLAMTVDGKAITTGETISTGEEFKGKKRSLVLTLIEPNPTLEARDFALKLSPVVAEEYQEAARGAAQEMAVSQKAYVFELCDEKGEPLQSTGFNFKNDDPSRATAHEDYTFYFKTTGVYGVDWEIADVPEEWLKVESENADAQGRLPIKFSLKAQNLSDKIEETGNTPVVLRSLLFGDSTPAELSRSFNFSQEKFSFGMEMPQVQVLGEKSYYVTNLPPALTADKLASEYGSLFSIDTGPISGGWEIGDGTSEWLTVSLARDGSVPATYGDFSDTGYKIYFAPKIANQKDNDAENEGVLKIVSSEHLKLYKTYAKVPGWAKHEWVVTQRGFSYNVKPREGNLFEGIPAYSNDFDQRRLVLDVECDGNWFINPSEIPDFLEHVGGPLSGDGTEGNYSIVFKPKANPSFREKSGSVRVYCTDRNNQEKSVGASQEAFVFELKDQEINLPAYVKDVQEINYKLTEGAQLKINAPSGINVSNSQSTLFATIGTNTSLTTELHRKVVVSVQEPAGVTKNASLSFVQHKYYFTREPAAVNFSELAKDTRELTFVSSGPWSLTTPGWLVVDGGQTEGEGSEEAVTVTLKANVNNSAAEREGTVRLTARELSGSAANLNTQASQKAFKWNVTADDDKHFNYSFGPLETQEYSVKVVSSGKWKISGMPEWVEMEQPSTEGSESGTPSTLKFKATKNLSTDAESRKSVQVALESDYYNSSVNNFRQLISVGQLPFKWNISSSDWGQEENNLSWNSPVGKDSKGIAVESSGDWKIVYGDKDYPMTGGSFDGWTLSTDMQSGVPVLRVTPSANNSREPHVTEFSIVSIEHEKAGKELKQDITLSQPEYILNVGENEDKLSFEPWNKKDEDSPLRSTIHVQSSAGWELVPEPGIDWVWAEKAKDNKSADIVVNNYPVKEEGRNAVLTLRSTEEGITLNQEISIHQEPFVFKTADPAKNNLTFTANGGTEDFEIICSAPTYTVKNPGNIASSVSRDSRTGNLHVEVGQYTIPGGRNGEILLESHGAELAIRITQGKFIFKTSGIEDNLHFSPKASGPKSELQFSLTSNVEWRLSYPDWMQLVSGPESDSDFTEEERENGKSYEFVFRTRDDNNSDTRRVGEIVLINEMLSLPYNVVQEGFMMGSTSMAFAEYNAPAKPLEFKSTLGWDVEIPDQYKSWLHVSRNSGSSTLSIKVDDNANTARNGSFAIKDTEGYGLSYTVNLSQEGFKWDVTGTGGHNFPTLPATADKWTFSVLSSAPCTIEPEGDFDSSWIDWTPKSVEAGKKTTVTVTAANNEGTGAREARLRVKASMGGKEVRSASIALSQSPFIFKLEEEVNELFFNPVEATSHEIKLQSSDGWSVDAPDWIELSKSEGSGDATITLTAKPNQSKRLDGKVTISSNIGGYKIEVNVTQDAFNNKSVTLNFDELDAAEQKVSVICSGNWKISGKTSWITVNPDSGSGNKSLSVSVTDNLDLTSRSRSLNIEFTAAGGFVLTKKITVSQKPFRFNDKTVQLNFEELPSGEKTFDIVCSKEWTISGKPDWITLSSGSNTDVTEGSDSQTIIVTAENYYETTTDRSAELTVTSTRSGRTKKIIVSQSAYKWNSEDTALAFTAMQTSKQSVDIVSSGKWKVQSKPSWVSVDPTEGSTGTTIELSVNPYYKNDTDRTDDIVIECLDIANLTKTITVTQSKYAFSVDKDGETFGFNPLGPSSHKISIVCSGPWTISTPDWITASLSEGSGSESEVTVTLTASNPNSGSEKKEGTVRIVSDPGGRDKYEADINVVQDAFAVTPVELVTFNELDATEQTASIVCSGDWTISGKPAWIKLSAESGSGNASLSVGAEDNTGLNERNGSVTVNFTATGGYHLSRTVSVSQKAFSWDNTAVEIDIDAMAETNGSFSITSSGDWTISGNPDWITLSESEGSGNKTITVTATGMNTGSERQAVITVTSKHNSALTKAITVRQAGMAAVSDVTGLADNTGVIVAPALVTAKTTTGFIISGGSKAIFVNDSGSNAVSIGDMVIVTGTKATAGTLPEITEITSVLVQSSGNPVSYPSATVVTDYATYQSTEAGFISVSGTMENNDGSFNIIFEGLEDIKGNITSPTSELAGIATGLEGQPATITGYFNGWSESGGIRYLRIIATTIE